MNNEIHLVIEHLNKLTGSTFDSNSTDVINLINNLFNKGYTTDDLIFVIDNKHSQWKGTKFAIFIRPSTLFGDKFINYYNHGKRTDNNRIQQLLNAVQKTKSTNWKLD